MGVWSRGYLLVAILMPPLVSFAADAPTEPRETINLGRVCAHNDGAGLLSAELTFRYAPGEIVLFDPAKLGSEGSVLLMVEWHLRDQTPVRALTSHLEAEVTVQERPDREPQTRRQTKDFGKNLPPAATYNDVDTFEQRIFLTRQQPLYVVTLTGKATAEAKLDRKVVGPESRTTFFVRQASLGTPEQSESLSRIVAGAYRRHYHLEELLTAYVRYLQDAPSRGDSPSSSEAVACERLQQTLREYVANQMGAKEDADALNADWARWNEFLQLKEVTLPSPSDSDARSARVRSLAREVGEVVGSGLLAEETRAELVVALPRLSAQLGLPRRLAEPFAVSKRCRSALLGMLAAESREELYRSSALYDREWQRVSPMLHLLRDALVEAIGFIRNPLSVDGSEASALSACLKPAPDCLFGRFLPADATGDLKSRAVEALRARLLPLWLYLETTAFGGFTREQQRMVATLAESSKLLAKVVEPSAPSPPAAGRAEETTVPATASATPTAEEGASGTHTDAARKNLPPEVAAAPTLSRDRVEAPLAVSIVTRGPRRRARTGAAKPSSSPASPPTVGGNAGTRSGTRQPSSPVVSVASSTSEDQRPAILHADFARSLNGWVKWHEAERHPGEYEVGLRNGEPGAYLVLRRGGSQLTLASLGADHAVNLTGEELQDAYLELEFEIVEQMLSGGGSSDAQFPLEIELTYVDTANKEQQWRFGFYADHSPVRPERAYRVERARWLVWKSVPLGRLLPDLRQLTRVRLCGRGWDFESHIRSFRIAPAPAK